MVSRFELKVEGMERMMQRVCLSKCTRLVLILIFLSFLPPPLQSSLNPQLNCSSTSYEPHTSSTYTNPSQNDDSQRRDGQSATRTAIIITTLYTIP